MAAVPPFATPDAAADDMADAAADAAADDMADAAADDIADDIAGVTPAALPDLSEHTFWVKVGKVPSTTVADGDCFLHAAADTAAGTPNGWKAPPETVAALRQQTSVVMRDHESVLRPIDVHHPGEFGQYCTAYGDSPPGKLPTKYWSDDCAVLATAHHLGRPIVKVEPCGDGSLLYSVFHKLQRREGVDEVEALALLRATALCVYFDGMNHYKRCVTPAEHSALPPLPPLSLHPFLFQPTLDNWLVDGWTPDQGTVIGGVTFFVRISRQGEELEMGEYCTWLDPHMVWRTAVVMAIFQPDDSVLRCLVQQCTEEAGVLTMGAIEAIEAEDLSFHENMWSHVLYRCGSQWVEQDASRVLCTLHMAKLTDMLWALAENVWVTGGRLVQQGSVPLQQHTLYIKPSRTDQPCDLCGAAAAGWRCTVRWRQTHHVRHWCAGCHGSATPVLALQLQLREWRQGRLDRQRRTPVEDVALLNRMFPFVGPAGGPPSEVPWDAARASLEALLPPLS